ncbi:hypothetical protein HOS33_gp228 [Erwinia phage vB_EamM_Y3]|uniref:Uncharacterized protein n=1 Tax=Erwinia phage vB_EamM_Y3 TaxID=1983553 RepID=A0A2H4IBD6_9CAUD|nr:hypothetical protein HOS33_gp228 [Erwinia phage vB_EamM_Y3]ARW58868.1 hypothetical protein Y3_228 [Erwinia phage vB_EamM_Y3]QZE56089.1 hypothetical protein pEaSNUABM52_00231 [Erwinia phage pEp_SNUABM_52]
MVNAHRYVHTAVRRFYAPHWIQFCDQIKVSPQTHGAFDKQDNMLGLQLPRNLFDQRIDQMVRPLKLVYSVKENEVESRCYLFGVRYYVFVFFEEVIAVSEDTYENVRSRTQQG